MKINHILLSTKSLALHIKSLITITFGRPSIKILFCLDMNSNHGDKATLLPSRCPALVKWHLCIGSSLDFIVTKRLLVWRWLNVYQSRGTLSSLRKGIDFQILCSINKICIAFAFRSCQICCKRLTLNVRGPSYLGSTRSISWLLMPWLFASPGHQQPWYWLCRMGRPLFYLRKDFNHLCQINKEEWHEMQIYVYCPSEKFST